MMFNQKDMEDKYGATQMCAVLGVNFIPSKDVFVTKGSIKRPLFYMHKQQAIIFPPSSDRDGTQLETINEVLVNARKKLEHKDLINKILLFPVAEEQAILFGWLPRNHWVTLHYDSHTEIATLIDSRPWGVSFCYCLSAMHTALEIGLAEFDMHVKTLNVKYQGVQEDTICCGAWTAANIEGLAEGISVDEYLSALSNDGKRDVIQHNINRVFHHKKNSDFYDKRKQQVDDEPWTNPALLTELSEGKRCV